MDIRPRPVEQSEDGGIDVPRGVRLRGAHAEGRLARMNTPTWPTPTALTHELGPRRDRGEYLADTLGVASKCPQRHMAVVGCEHHRLDGGHLADGELTWVGARAGETIVEGTSCRGVAPDMQTSRFEAEDPEDECKREDGLRTLDGAEDIRLGRALGESSAGKAETRDAEQNQQEPDHGGEDACSTVELGEGLEKVLPVLLQGLDGDDRTKTALPPGPYCGAGDGEATTQRRRAGTHHMLAETMVVGAALARWGRADREHRCRITQRARVRRKPE
jgi:hypothetical protein